MREREEMGNKVSWEQIVQVDPMGFGQDLHLKIKTTERPPKAFKSRVIGLALYF